MDSTNHPGRRPEAAPPALVPAVPDLTARFVTLWNEGGPGRPDLGRTFTGRERSSREKALAGFVDVLREEAGRPSAVGEEAEAGRQRIFDAFARFARAGLDWQDRHVDILFGGGFDRAAAEFVRKARAFDPALGGADVFQACRNVWVANGLQRLLGLPVRLTPGIFAYSLLYPYTDNYLDDPAVPGGTKRSFDGRLRSRLEGGAPAPANTREKTIFDLVGMIEGDFDRASSPQVFESLLAIQEGQAKSLRLLGPDAPRAEEAIAAISLEKGGTSVLADGCLAAGRLGPDQVEFLFGFGAFLQLMDDLEDVAEDREAGLRTVFSRAIADVETLDAVTDRTFRFGVRVLGGLGGFGVPDAAPLRELIRSSLVQGVVSTAGRFTRLYSRAYLRALEAHSPFRFSFAKKQRRRLERRRAGLARLFDSLS
ncbi:MAG TPA: hypothetical protein VMS75_06050 [Terriglobales bacterium]|nr:hypothetical protein [Terriglobales bacterium]